MSNEDKVFALLERMYGEFQELKQGQLEIKTDMLGMKTDINGLINRIDKIESTVTKIENNHGQKLEALLDGYKQNAEKLDRIESEVSKHEEIILRRIK